MKKIISLMLAVTMICASIGLTAFAATTKMCIRDRVIIVQQVQRNFTWVLILIYNSDIIYNLSLIHIL